MNTATATTGPEDGPTSQHDRDDEHEEHDECSAPTLRKEPRAKDLLAGASRPGRSVERARGAWDSAPSSVERSRDSLAPPPSIDPLVTMPKAALSRTRARAALYSFMVVLGTLVGLVGGLGSTTLPPLDPPSMVAIARADEGASPRAPRTMRFGASADVASPKVVATECPRGAQSPAPSSTPTSARSAVPARRGPVMTRIASGGLR